MTQVKDYVLLLVGACLVCGGLTILAPSGQFERIIQVIGSIFLLLCMLSPLSGALEKVFDYRLASESPDPLYQTSDAWEYSAQAMSQTLKSTINDYVMAVTGHKARRIDITIDNDSSSFTLTDICITVDADDAAKKTAIADYVAIKTGTRPTVISQSIGE